MVNGSSATGHCSNVSNNEFTSTCTDPTSSVLFDGVIPALTGLDGDMWASQLLTLQRTNSSTIEVAFIVTVMQNLERVELVMFNCPEWGISVQSISLRDNDHIVIGSSGDLNSITSCDSLVRLCVPATAINPLVVRVQFDLGTGSNWVHLAEVKLYDDSSTCPPNTTIITVSTTQEMTAATTAALTTPTTTATTTQGATTVTTAAPTTPTTTTTITQEMTIVTITIPTIPTIETTTTQEMTTATMESDTKPENGTAINEGVIIPVVVVICVVFMIVGIMAAVLIQWRYHKHKTSHHTALGEGHSHAHTHSHPPPVNKYEETGQVCYSSPPEALPSHDTYSHLQRDTSEGRGGAQSEWEYSVVHMKERKGKGEYSVLFHANKPHMLERDKMEGMRTGDSTTHVYAQIDGVKKEKKETGSTGVTTHPAAYSSLDMSKSWEMAKPDTHLYDQVDKGKKDEVTTHPHTPEADTAVDHSYAVLEDNREKKKGEVSTHHHTPETDTAVDHFYAVLEDNREKKKGEVATHPHTPETDTAVDQLCAQVDKNQKEKEVCVPLQESGPVYSALNKPSPPQLPAKSDLLMEDLQTP